MSEEAQVLRVGHEEYRVLERRELKERCHVDDHPLFLVTTEERGNFVVCDDCPYAIKRAEDLEQPEETT